MMLYVQYRQVKIYCLIMSISAIDIYSIYKKQSFYLICLLPYIDSAALQ